MFQIIMPPKIKKTMVQGVEGVEGDGQLITDDATDTPRQDEEHQTTEVAQSSGAGETRRARRRKRRHASTSDSEESSSSDSSSSSRRDTGSENVANGAGNTRSHVHGSTTSHVERRITPPHLVSLCLVRVILTIH